MQVCMSKLFTFVSGLTAALALVVGMGITGGPRGSDNPLSARYLELIGDADPARSGDLMSHYSSDYLHECQNLSDVRATWSEVLSTPKLRLTFCDFRTTGYEISEDSGFLAGTVAIEIDDNGQITEGEVEIAMWFTKRNGAWLLSGNQRPGEPRPTGNSLEAKLRNLLGQRHPTVGRKILQ